MCRVTGVLLNMADSEKEKKSFMTFLPRRIEETEVTLGLKKKSLNLVCNHLYSTITNKHTQRAMQPYFCNQHSFLQTAAEQKQQTFNKTDRQC